MMIYDDGGYAHTAGLPHTLYTSLQKLKRNQKWTPEYIALGSEERYYLRYDDGTYEWFGNAALKASCAEADQRQGLESIAFGQSFDSYFIVYGDGGYISEDAPAELLKIVGKRGDLECVSLGSAGEWYIRFTDGSAQWGGLDDQVLPHIRPLSKRITFIDFGSNLAYFVRLY